VRGESFDKGNTSKSKFENRKSNKFCRYCRKPGHVISECFKLKNKREKEEDNSHSHPHETESDSDDDVFFTTFTEKGSVSDWILDSGCIYYICLYKD